tara:strand:+ start:240 stop:908 length:669 start_codon:yes stop_codon:yes gene_type:complete
MNFKELQDEVSELINFNSLQTDQDFTTAQVKSAVNRAYAREYRKARQEGIRSFFFAYRDLVWESGSLTLSLPENMRGSQICKITDVTDDSSGSGYHVVVYDGGAAPTGTPSWTSQGFSGAVFWKDRHSLQWGTSGPSEEKTLRFEFMAEPGKMLTDDETPDLIPSNHHELIFFSAAIDLRTRADEMAPPSWVHEREELRMDFYKDVSRGRPHTSVTSIDFVY